MLLAANNHMQLSFFCLKSASVCQCLSFTLFRVPTFIHYQALRWSLALDHPSIATPISRPHLSLKNRVRVERTSMATTREIEQLLTDGLCATSNYVALHSLLSSGDYSDMTIRCRGREFKTHRAVVCSQSPFFKTALSSNFKVGVWIRCGWSEPY